MRVKVDDTIFRRSTMPTTPTKKQARQIINWFLNPNKFASHGLVFDNYGSHYRVNWKLQRDI